MDPALFFGGVAAGHPVEMARVAGVLAGLRRLAERHELIGDVRGAGLFLGVELVRDRATLEPAGAEAEEVALRMRRRGVLIGTDGPHHNVLKIRPALNITMDQCEEMMDILEECLDSCDH